MEYVVQKADTDDIASMKELWKKFNIEKAPEFIDHAWQQVSRRTMDRVEKTGTAICCQFSNL
jgi:hypothetical protein